MAKYLFFESQDPFESKDVSQQLALAAQLKTKGNEVVVFLVENGVLPARRCSESMHIENLLKQGVKVYADHHALNERGIGKDTLVTGVQMDKLEAAMDCIADGYKTIWH